MSFRVRQLSYFLAERQLPHFELSPRYKALRTKEVPHPLHVDVKALPRPPPPPLPPPNCTLALFLTFTLKHERHNGMLSFCVGLMRRSWTRGWVRGACGWRAGSWLGGGGSVVVDLGGGWWWLGGSGV